MSPTKDQLYWTLGELAEATNYSLSYLRALVREGTLKAERKGRHYYIKKHDAYQFKNLHPCKQTHRRVKSVLDDL